MENQTKWKISKSRWKIKIVNTSDGMHRGRLLRARWGSWAPLLSVVDRKALSKQCIWELVNDEVSWIALYVIHLWLMTTYSYLILLHFHYEFSKKNCDIIKADRDNDEGVVHYKIWFWTFRWQYQGVLLTRG